jgi:hypothetical protein
VSAPTTYRKRGPNRQAARIEHEDIGCSWHRRCLECPEAACRFDGKTGGIRIPTARNDAIRRAHGDGASIVQICRRWNIHRRQVFRILSTAKSASAGL